MKLLVFALALTQVGCATYLIPARPRPAPRYANEFETIRWAREMQKKNASQWAEWDKKYVADDVILVEIVNKNTRD
jgi:hypothetical protein